MCVVKLNTINVSTKCETNTYINFLGAQHQPMYDEAFKHCIYLDFYVYLFIIAKINHTKFLRNYQYSQFEATVRRIP